ncbi:MULTISPECIES: AraC family transcriptional regulator [unclassified Agarivorans]|uniref:AraC family transcriptional regulator n=1 Tax=unclassified Agarivorans TaxID=2636026 RepID=UPI0026E1B920|nr:MULTISPECIES: AraC family transcriptional regulator [unclassified Agarivorans]MDO6684812.1 AraC family transcriptional regulator ligand-binding domain-containing protein [Agarivorans sp. 3_MG-2023]MDO6715027.1 AraC family transcriptional regulator ligand-binding domain-containing protein [Agarivorans sp. 2_MG-2023]
MTADEYFRFWQALDQMAGDIELPLKFAESFNVECFDPPIFASLCSPNFNTALERLQRFKPLIAPLKLELAFTSKTTRLSLEPLQANQQLSRTFSMTELVFFTQLLRTATRKHIEPIAVYCPIAVSSPERYREYFGVAVKQSGSLALEFSAEDASLPFLTENTGMWSIFEPELQKRLSNLERDASIQQRVKSALLELIPSAQVSIENVASQLAMSKRTLQRKLSAENANYQNILNDTRQELAEFYLSKTPTSTSEVSFLLGFHETTSFYRAFSGWTGQSPERYREQNSVVNTH